MRTASSARFGIFFQLLIGFLFCFVAACDPVQKEEMPETQIKPPSSWRNPDNFSDDCTKLRAEAFAIDSMLLQQVETDDSLAASAIKAFTDFAYYCHSDSMSPVYLVKTAQVARAVGNIPQAQRALEFCISEFRDFSGRPATLFLLAQLYEDRSYLYNRDEAQRLYKEIIAEYPKSDWAASAEGALNLLGKSDAEILKMLKEKS